MYTCLHASLLIGFCLHEWVECGCHLFFYPPSELEVCVYACAYQYSQPCDFDWYLPFFVKNPFYPFCTVYGTGALEYAIYIEWIDQISHVYSGIRFSIIIITRQSQLMACIRWGAVVVLERPIIKGRI